MNSSSSTVLKDRRRTLFKWVTLFFGALLLCASLPAKATAPSLTVSGLVNFDDTNGTYYWSWGYTTESNVAPFDSVAVPRIHAIYYGTLGQQFPNAFSYLAPYRTWTGYVGGDSASYSTSMETYAYILAHAPPPKNGFVLDHVDFYVAVEVDSWVDGNSLPSLHGQWQSATHTIYP